MSRIKRAANALLKKARLVKPPVPVEAIAEGLGIEVRYEPFENEISGVLYRDKERVIIGVNSLHHPNRQRFTIAHELGHFSLHEMDIHVDRGYRVVLRDQTSSQATDPLEIEANKFASELLMPNEMVIRDAAEYLGDLENQDGLDRLAERYKVSTQAMAFKLSKLRFISL